MGNMSSDRPEAEYPCSQQELYTIAENGWTSYGQHLSVFAGKRSIYTAQKGTDALAALVAAIALPDKATRVAQHSVLRVELVAMGAKCRIIWDELDSMVRDTYESTYSIRNDEAGHGFYAAASNEDWEAVKALMKGGADFIAQHNADLAGPLGGMLPTFPAQFNTVRSAFEAKYLQFKQAEELTRTLTDEKIAANNAVYKELMKMFADGQKYFRFQASIRYEFTFDRVWGMISGNGGGGSGLDGMKFWGVVTDQNGQPLASATVRLGNTDGFVEVQTTATGGYSIPVDDIDEPVSATLAVNKVGFAPSSRPVTAMAGVNQEQNFQLVPMVPPVP